MKKVLITSLIVFSFAGVTAQAIEMPGDNNKLITPLDMQNFQRNFFETSSAYGANDVEQTTVDSVNSSGRKGSMPMFKKLRLQVQKNRYEKETGIVKPKKRTFFGKPVIEQNSEEINPVIVQEKEVRDAILDCDEMEYYPENNELEAKGNILVTFPKDNSTLKSDKLFYNQSSNVIRAIGNVVLTRDGEVMTGEYLQVNMNEESSFIDKPIADNHGIEIRAKKGFMYGDTMIQEQGQMLCKTDKYFKTKTSMLGGYMEERRFVPEEDKMFLQKDIMPGNYKIKAQNIIIKAGAEHDTITLKKAELHYADKKIGITIPTVTFHTNKTQDYIEGNYPEIGSLSKIGMFAGPGLVIDAPMGSTVKLIPVVNYKSKFGFGGMVKFKNANNFTDVGYGSAEDVFILRGRHRLDDDLYLQYGVNTYMYDGFMGTRMPKYGVELFYDKGYDIPDFLAKDLNMTFNHRLSAGFMKDNDWQNNYDNYNTAGNISTMRFKYMAQIYQSLFKRENEEEQKMIDFGVNLQGSAAVYGTGDTQFFGAVGPRMMSQYKGWMQDIGFNISAISDQTPMPCYDAYRYGSSHIYFREFLRVHPLLTLGWLGSAAINNENKYTSGLLQECAFFVRVGPDDLTVTLGFDVIRQQTYVTFDVGINTKGSSVEYERMEVKKVDRVGRANKEKEDALYAFQTKMQLQKDKENAKVKAKLFGKQVVEEEQSEPVLENAMVTDMERPTREQL